MTRSIASSPNPIVATAHRATSRLALLWLVLALLCQGFVTQTHAHSGTEQGWSIAGIARAATATADDQKRSPAAPACPLCEEKALFGAYLLGGSITLAKPVEVTVAYAATSFAAFIVPLRSHAWQSRAPPLFTT
ncbi:MAG: hypothetical protein E7773_08325 [Sphingomonas sp.]|uniref:hypothetical protein n=1 Tax=Sphingomonas sp. TaxID=28214 RepID=UPI00120BEEBE|nr:hypothetical protein [Sphingomonas sp.]THD35943.1 MAG: hypothetical protein E7773_08325 [Sphingomonas sp.]